MRNFFYTAVAIVVAGCATTNPAAVQAAETASEYLCISRPYPGFTDCVRGQFDLRYPGWRRDANADLVDIFLAWSQAAGERVVSGQLSDAEAHRQAETRHDRLNPIAYQRQVQRQIDSPAAAT